MHFIVTYIYLLNLSEVLLTTNNSFKLVLKYHSRDKLIFNVGYRKNLIKIFITDFMYTWKIIYARMI